MQSIAVIIPCYNGAGFLGGAIASALAQSHPPSTVLVVDDGSVDQSVAIAEEYAHRGFPVRIVKLVRNAGPASARNAGIDHTVEPLIAFLDADDRWSERHCESLLGLLTKHPDADLAFSRTHSTDPAVGDSRLRIPAGRPLHMLNELLDDSFIPQSAVLARRDSILAAGGYTEGMRYSEDYDLWLRMAHGGKFIASNECTCIRISHAAQATRHAERMYRGAWEARAQYLSFALRSNDVVTSDLYEQIAGRAFERDLREAWRSRSFALLRSVLSLAEVVPGAGSIHRRWTVRAFTIWPVWRLAAFCWDHVPGSWRSALKATRNRGRMRGGPGPL